MRLKVILAAMTQSDGPVSRISKDDYFLEIEQRTLVIRFLGSWSGDIAEPFFADFQQIVKSIAPRGPWATLLDLTNWSIVSHDALRLGLETVALCDRNGRAHSALMMGSLDLGQMLVEMQIVDVKRPNMRHFATEEKARAWLAELGYLGS